MGVALDAAAYQRAAAIFGEIITSLSSAEWEAVTHPDDWTVATSVAWVVVGDAQIPFAARGETVEPTGDFDAAVLGPNPVASWRGTAVAAVSALREPGTSIDAVVAQRVSENLLRSWDVASAVGRPVSLPEDLIDSCLDFWAEHGEQVLAGGVLPDTPIQPRVDASLEERFLALMGRPVP